ncbi:MAG TPA: sugar ABC transporter permease [Tepidisphaeraceae bacterium]|nr:sugar ABC transporter permease [Tepidisphaeraceae bacterium]
MRTETKNLFKGLGFISPWLIGFCAFTLIPISMSLYYSFCNYSLLQKPVFIGLDNYRELIHDPNFWTVNFNTLLYAVLALPAGLLIALALALLLNVKIRGQSVYRTLIFLPSLVPAVAAAMLWLWLFNSKLGLVNFVLRGLGMTDPPGWLTDAHWALPSLVLISFWGVGNTVVIFLAGLQDVPTELFEAADLDGAGRFQTLRHVTLPSISPVIFFNLIMGIIGTLQVFVLPFIMTQGGPGRATYLYTEYMYDNAFGYLKMGYCSAMAWLQLLVILGLTAIAFWSSKRWVHYQGK